MGDVLKWTTSTVICFTVFYCAFAAPFQSSLRLPRDRGCYYLMKHYSNGERIETNEPCLNCTCVNSMLMCYLRICPFAKPLGSDCTIERSEGECCPSVWCPGDYTPTAVPIETTTQEPLGCFINGEAYPDGAQLPRNPDKPCEVCYCIRNSSACVMQECELKVEGCSPVYREPSCCPSRYNCSRYVATTQPPGPASTEKPTGCTVNGHLYADGERVKSEDPCNHCYCMRDSVVCAVEKCHTPGEGCVPYAISDGQCCPFRYDCQGMEVAATDITTDVPHITSAVTTISTELIRIEQTQPTLIEEITEQTAASSQQEILKLTPTSTEYEIKESISTVAPFKATERSTSSSSPAETEGTEAGVTSSTLAEIVENTELPTTSVEPEIIHETTSHSTQDEYDTQDSTPTRLAETELTGKDASSSSTETSFDIKEQSSTTVFVTDKRTSDVLEAITEDESKGAETSIPPEVAITKHITTAPVLFQETTKNISSFIEEEITQTSVTPIPTSFEQVTKEILSTLSDIKTEETSSILTSSTSSEADIVSQKITIPSELEKTEQTTESTTRSYETTQPTYLEDTEKEEIIKDEIIVTEQASTEASKPTPLVEITTISGLIESTTATTRKPIPASSIPGEGNCQYSTGIYQNGESVIAGHPCEKDCVCNNSVVACGIIECEPIPEDSTNCRIITKPDECCPYYECDPVVDHKLPPTRNQTKIDDTSPQPLETVYPQSTEGSAQTEITETTEMDKDLISLQTSTKMDESSHPSTKPSTTEIEITEIKTVSIIEKDQFHPTRETLEIYTTLPDSFAHITKEEVSSVIPETSEEEVKEKITVIQEKTTEPTLDSEEKTKITSETLETTTEYSEEKPVEILSHTLAAEVVTFPEKVSSAEDVSTQPTSSVKVSEDVEVKLTEISPDFTKPPEKITIGNLVTEKETVTTEHDITIGEKDREPVIAEEDENVGRKEGDTLKPVILHESTTTDGIKEVTGQTEPSIYTEKIKLDIGTKISTQETIDTSTVTDFVKTEKDEITKTTLPQEIIEELDKTVTVPKSEKDCIVNDTVYKDGEVINGTFPCEYCYCASGDVLCHWRICKPPRPDCLPRLPSDGQCCPNEYDCKIDGEETTTIIIPAVEEEEISSTPSIFRQFTPVHSTEDSQETSPQLPDSKTTEEDLKTEITEKSTSLSTESTTTTFKIITEFPEITEQKETTDEIISISPEMILLKTTQSEESTDVITKVPEEISTKGATEEVEMKTKGPEEGFTATTVKIPEKETKVDLSEDIIVDDKNISTEIITEKTPTSEEVSEKTIKIIPTEILTDIPFKFTEADLKVTSEDQKVTETYDTFSTVPKMDFTTEYKTKYITTQKILEETSSIAPVTDEEILETTQQTVETKPLTEEAQFSEKVTKEHIVTKVPEEISSEATTTTSPVSEETEYSTTQKIKTKEEQETKSVYLPSPTTLVAEIEVHPEITPSNEQIIADKVTTVSDLTKDVHTSTIPTVKEFDVEVITGSPPQIEDRKTETVTPESIASTDLTEVTEKKTSTSTLTTETLTTLSKDIEEVTKSTSLLLSETKTSTGSTSITSTDVGTIEVTSVKPETIRTEVSIVEDKDAEKEKNLTDKFTEIVNTHEEVAFTESISHLETKQIDITTQRTTTEPEILSTSTVKIPLHVGSELISGESQTENVIKDVTEITPAHTKAEETREETVVTEGDILHTEAETATKKTEITEEVHPDKETKRQDEEKKIVETSTDSETKRTEVTKETLEEETTKSTSTSHTEIETTSEKSEPTKTLPTVSVTADITEDTYTFGVSQEVPVDSKIEIKETTTVHITSEESKAIDEALNETKHVTEVISATESTSALSEEEKIKTGIEIAKETPTHLATETSVDEEKYTEESPVHTKETPTHLATETSVDEEKHTEESSVHTKETPTHLATETSVDEEKYTEESPVHTKETPTHLATETSVEEKYTEESSVHTKETPTHLATETSVDEEKYTEESPVHTKETPTHLATETSVDEEKYTEESSVYTKSTEKTSGYTEIERATEEIESTEKPSHFITTKATVPTEETVTFERETSKETDEKADITDRTPVNIEFTEIPIQVETENETQRADVISVGSIVTELVSEEVKTTKDTTQTGETETTPIILEKDEVSKGTEEVRDIISHTESSKYEETTLSTEKVQEDLIVSEKTEEKVKEPTAGIIFPLEESTKSTETTTKESIVPESTTLYIKIQERTSSPVSDLSSLAIVDSDGTTKPEITTHPTIRTSLKPTEFEEVSKTESKSWTYLFTSTQATNISEVTEPSTVVTSTVKSTSSLPTEDSSEETIFVQKGACVFNGIVYQSAEQIPRTDACEFCFCFRGDIICLHQGCPPPMSLCYEREVPGFCCPHYVCHSPKPLYNVSDLSTRQSRIGKRSLDHEACRFDGRLYKVGEVIKKYSTPCRKCKCDKNGTMTCDPQKCRPEKPLLLRMNKAFFQK